MISVEQAEALIFESVSPTPDVDMPLAEARGAFLRECIVADRPFPPYHRVAMDGIALSSAAWARGVRAFRVAGIQRAGAPAGRLESSDTCLEVMTGAVLPEGCDAVIPVEKLSVTDHVAQVRDGVTPVPLLNVHALGSDRGAGAVLLRPGTRLLGPQLAVAASVGRTQVRVAACPRLALISTGDELVDIGATPLPHQVRRSNTEAMRAALVLAGFPGVMLAHEADDLDAIRRRLEEVLATCSVILLSGGVSEGRYDHVPGALAALGVKARFHKVSQQPGKPLWFGVGPAGQAVFGLPGNPVSAVVCLHRYVLPALWRQLGACVLPPARRPHAVLATAVEAKKDLTLFRPVRLREDGEGRRLAVPVALNGSGDLTGLAASDGVIELPGGGRTFAAGEAHVVWPWADAHSVQKQPDPGDHP